MEERRKFVRLSARLPATYRVLGADHNLPSLTTNVGGGGVALFTETRFAPGTVLEVEVAFPNRPQPVRFTAQVVWSGPLLLGERDASLSRTFETGVRFLEIFPDDRAVIIQYGVIAQGAS